MYDIFLFFELHMYASRFLTMHDNSIYVQIMLDVRKAFCILSRFHLQVTTVRNGQVSSCPQIII